MKLLVLSIMLMVVSCGYETRESKTYLGDDCCEDNCKPKKKVVVVKERKPEQRPPVIFEPKQEVDIDIDIDVDQDIQFECCDDYGCQPCDDQKQSKDDDEIRKPVRKPVFCDKYPGWHTCNVNNNTNNNRVIVR